MSIEKAIVDKSGAKTKTHAKVSDGSQLANLELEAESFLRGITNEVKWQELVSKWLAFEKDYPTRGVIFLFFNVVSFGANDMLMVLNRSYQLRVARRKLHGG
jgi:hypothetical protein